MKANPNPAEVRTYTDPAAAEDACRRRNRFAKGRDLAVMVDGPDDDETTVMSIQDAIASGFLYRWVA